MKEGADRFYEATMAALIKDHHFAKDGSEFSGWGSFDKDYAKAQKALRKALRDLFRANSYGSW